MEVITMLENVNVEEIKAYYYELLSRKSVLLGRLERYGELAPRETIILACLDAQVEFSRSKIPNE